MALSKKERERIIEEETLRFETRRNLGLQHCPPRRRWPWVLAGLGLVWLLYSWIFCGRAFCTGWHKGCGHGAEGRPYHSWQSEAQPEAPRPQAPRPGQR